jgi:hypothetical protein
VALARDGSLVVVGSYSGLGEAVDVGGGPLPDHGDLEDVETSDDVFVARYRPDGSHLGSIGFGGRDSMVRWSGLALDAWDNSLVVGRYAGTPDLGHGPLPLAGFDGRDAAWLLKLSARGVPLWSHGFSGSGLVGISDVAAAGGHVYVVGSYTGTLDVPGAGRLERSTESPGTWLLVLDSEGRALSLHGLVGGRGGSYPTALEVDGTGALVLGVMAAGEVELGGTVTERAAWTPHVVKYGPDLRYHWHKALTDGSAGHPSLWQDVRVGPGDAIAVTGAYEGTLSFAGAAWPALHGAEAYVALLGPEGEERWVDTVRGDGLQAGLSVAFSPGGRVYVAGSFTHAAEVCGRYVGPERWGAHLSFLVRYEADGRCGAVRAFEQLGFEVWTDVYGLAASEDGLYLGGTFSFDVDFGQGPVGARRYDGFLLGVEP